jgi:hypothetical protein
MKYYDMTPIAKPHSNGMLGGRPAAPHEENVIGGKVHGMPISRNEQRIVSVWKCASIWQRLQFLIHGEITLTVLGSIHPAVCVSVNDTLSCENDKAMPTASDKRPLT